MTELAYMVREDWGQHGTAMVPQSAVIRGWVGEAPYLFAVADAAKFKTDREADLEAADFVAPDASSRKVFSIGELASLSRQDKVIDHALVVVQPHNEFCPKTLASAVEQESLNRVFVLIWAPTDIVRTWLDGRGALNLHTGEALEAPDPLVVAAAESMVDEENNSLSSGRGKDAVVQLVRAFAAEGYPVAVDVWLRAYFAAGGTFRHAEEIAKLINEMKAGTQHRVKQRYAQNIVEVLRDQIAARGDRRTVQSPRAPRD